MSQTTVEQPLSERDKVESWRLHVLIEAGYPLPLAERLAHSDADLFPICGRGFGDRSFQQGVQ